MKIEKIYLVPHFHFDFEWWKEEPFHELDTLAIMDEAFNMLDNYPEFTYVIDTVLPLKKYIEKRKDGIERIKSFIDRGRVEIVGGNIVAPDEVLPVGEALIRQFEEGQAWLKEVFGIQAQVAWEIDEFAHPARMPQILAPLGFKNFVFARGVQPFDSMHPTLFNWHDPSGKSKLTTYWWAASYEGFLPGKIQNEKAKKRQLKRFFREMESRLEFEGERSTVPWLMVPMGGDFTIPNEVWMDFVKLWNETKDVKLEFTLPSRYFQMVEHFTIPDYTGLFPHVFDGYFTSREKVKQTARKNANDLLELEKLISLAGIHGYKTSGKELKEAWWEVLKGDSHDTIAGTGTDRVYRKTLSRYENAEILQQQAREKVIDFLNGIVKGNRNFVFNGLNWEREEIICSDGKEMLVRASPLSLQRIEKNGSSDDFLIVEKTSIENRFLRIEINEKNGNISVFDKEKDFHPIMNGCNLTSIVDDVGNLWVTRTSGKKYPVRFKDFSIRKESEFSAVITLQEENRFVSVRKEIMLPVNSKQINFKTDIAFEGKDKRIDMEFPFTFEGEWITENVFHTEKVSEGIHPVQNFTLFKGKNYSAAIINKGIPGYSLEEGKGSLMLLRSVSMFSWFGVRWVLKNSSLVFRSLMQASIYLRKKLHIVEFPAYPVHHLFLRDFATEGNLLGHGALNRKSHRKARLRFYKESLAWERGDHSFSYAILMGVQNTGEAVRKGIEFNRPLRYLPMEGRGEIDNISMLPKEARDIVISSVRQNHQGLIVRAYEPGGRKIETKLEFAFPLKRVFKFSCNSDEAEELSPEENSIRDVYEPYDMVMYKIEY